MRPQLANALRSTARVAVTTCVAVLGLTCTLPCSGQQAATPDPVFRTAAFTIDNLQSVTAACFDDSGNLYVLEQWASRVRLFSADTRSPLRSFGRIGDRRTEFHDPHDIAHSDGNLVVADTGNNRVQLFSTDGSFRLEVDSSQDRLLAPKGVAIDRTTIAVADTGNHRVVLYDLDGRPRQTLGQYGFGDGQLVAPHDVARDHRGHTWVCDTGNHRIVEFDAEGAFVQAIGDRGSPPGFFDHPMSIVAFQDHLYIADSRNHRIQVLSTLGDTVGSWGVHSIRPHDGEGRLHYPMSVAIDPRADFDERGRTAVVCEPFEDRVQGFFSVADPNRPPPRALPGNPTTDTHFSTRASLRGSLAAIVTEGESAIAIYDVNRSTPTKIHEFGRHGRNPGELVHATDVVLGNDRRIYVCDPLARRISIYEHSWTREEKVRYRPRMTRWVRSIDTAALQRSIPLLAALPTLELDLLAVGSSGELYLMDSRLGVVVVLDNTFTYQRHFGGSGSKQGLFRGATDLEFDSQNRRLLVVDAGNARLQVFKPNGTYLHSIGRRGAQQFVRLFGVALADNGTLYVTDMAMNRVEVLHSADRSETTWGMGTDKTTLAERLAPALLFKPAGIVTSGRHVLTVDWGHHRAQLHRVAPAPVDGDSTSPFSVFGARPYLKAPR